MKDKTKKSNVIRAAEKFMPVDVLLRRIDAAKAPIDRRCYAAYQGAVKSRMMANIFDEIDKLPDGDPDKVRLLDECCKLYSDEGETMSRKTVGDVVGPIQLIQILTTNIRDDLSRLQVSILKENKHDVGTHLGDAIERVIELEKKVDALERMKRSE